MSVSSAGAEQAGSLQCQSQWCYSDLRQVIIDASLRNPVLGGTFGRVTTRIWWRLPLPIASPPRPHPSLPPSLSQLKSWQCWHAAPAPAPAGTGKCAPGGLRDGWEGGCFEGGKGAFLDGRGWNRERIGPGRGGVGSTCHILSCAPRPGRRTRFSRRCTT